MPVRFLLQVRLQEFGCNVNITNSRVYFTLAIEIFLDLSIVTDYLLCEYRVKELLHVSSLVGIDRVIVFIDGLYIDVDEKFLCVHGI